MPRFFIIDQSMCQPAGHHFDYTRNLAVAAASNDFETIVGANRRLETGSASDLAADSVRCCFENTTYSRLSYLHGLRSLTRSPQPPRKSESQGWLARRKYNKYLRQRAAFVEQFYLDCQQFFAGVTFKPDDQVFFVTMSELECEGLAKFLVETPAACEANWHLQFHFELYSPVAKQSETDQCFETVKTLFQTMKKQLSDNVYFYATSDGLSRQYNTLDAFRFETLAYPVNAGFFEHRKTGKTGKTGGGKTQVACFGGIRREKGLKTLLPLLAQSLAAHPSAQEKIELVIQGKPSQLPRQVQQDSPGLRWVPLPAENYVDLVHESDIGLLYYDRETFANRVSSTLYEFLCAGKPVIVSSASWLHEQIENSIADYQIELFEQSTRIDAADLQIDGSTIRVDLGKFQKPHRLVTIKGESGSGKSKQRVLTAIASAGGQTISENMEAVSQSEQNTLTCCTKYPGGCRCD